MRISDWSSDVCSSDLLRADISAGTLPLAALLAPAADGDKAGKGGNAGSGGGAGTALPASRERWSRKPLDLAALRAIDAAVKLVATALVADKLRLTTARLDAAQTGRASCRATVSHSVVLSVAPLSLKKNKT